MLVYMCIYAYSSYYTALDNEPISERHVKIDVSRAVKPLGKDTTTSLKFALQNKIGHRKHGFITGRT